MTYDNQINKVKTKMGFERTDRRTVNVLAKQRQRNKNKKDLAITFTEHFHYAEDTLKLCSSFSLWIYDFEVFPHQKGKNGITRFGCSLFNFQIVLSK